MKEKLKGFLPVLLFFVVLNSLFIAGRSLFEERGVDQDILILGNALIFLITLFSFLIAQRGLHHPNPNVFMRMVMGSIMVKMFLLVIVAFIYISLYKENLNKPALFICMGLYLVYNFMEVSALMKRLKQKTNG